MFLQTPTLLRPPCMAGSYLAYLLLSLLHAFLCYLPNKPFSLPTLDSFFILAPNTGNFLYLSCQRVCCKVPVLYVHVSSLEQFSQHSKQGKELILGKTLTPRRYLSSVHDHAILTHVLFEIVSVVFSDSQLLRPTGMTRELHSPMLTLI